MNTKSTITDKRVTSVIERLEHYACNLKWTNVRGSQDLLTAADGLRELQERRKVERDTEPYGFTDGDRRGMIYKPEHSDRLTEPVPVYRHAQPVPVVSAELLHTAASAIEDLLTTKDRTGACVWFDLPFRLRSAANAQLAPVVPDAATAIRACLSEFPESARDIVEECADIAENACRAAMLQAGNSPAQSDCCPAQNVVVPAQSPIDHGYRPECECSGCKATSRICAELAGNPPVIPDGYVMLPMKLTAENGAKGALSGEFSETKFVNCPECFGDEECETCDGSGKIEITVPVTWTTIKEIWAKGVEHFAAAPQSPGGDHATVPGKWILVSERMPESNKFVLVSNGVWVGQGLYDDSEHLESDEHWQDEHREFINVLHHPVTHWMPLPAAPQEPKP